MTDVQLARQALKRVGVVNAEELDDRQVGNLVSTLFGSLVSVARSLATITAAVTVAPGKTAPAADRSGLVALFRAFADVLEQDTELPVEDLVAALGAEVPHGD